MVQFAKPNPRQAEKFDAEEFREATAVLYRRAVGKLLPPLPWTLAETLAVLRSLEYAASYRMILVMLARGLVTPGRNELGHILFELEDFRAVELLCESNRCWMIGSTIHRSKKSTVDLQREESNERMIADPKVLSQIQIPDLLGEIEYHADPKIADRMLAELRRRLTNT